MNKYYVMGVLYAYPNMEPCINRIDSVIAAKAKHSAHDLRPCIEIANEISLLKVEKQVFKTLKKDIKDILSRFTEDEQLMFEYRYYRSLDDEARYERLDVCNRNYYKKQARILDRFSKALAECGYDDDWFDVLGSKIPLIEGCKNKATKIVETNRQNRKGKNVNE